MALEPYPSEAWYRAVLDNHYEEALARANSLLVDVVQTENGCWQTPTEEPRKLRFRGRQDRLYRFSYVLYHRLALRPHEIVRHRCDNRVCVNPAHLQLGDRGENNWDQQEFDANGVDRLAL